MTDDRIADAPDPSRPAADITATPSEPEPDLDWRTRSFDVRARTPHLAARGLRLGAYLLDWVFFLVFYIPMIMMIELERLHGDPAMKPLVAMFAFGFLVLWLVKAILLCVRGQSLGLLIVGIRIVRHEDGRPAGFVHAWLLREFITGLICMIPCVGVVFWLANALYIFAADRRCLHDHLAGTVVVYIQPREPL